MTTETAVTETETTSVWAAFDGSTVTATELANRPRASVGIAARWLARRASEDFLTFDETTSRYANFCSLPRAA